MTQKGQLGPLSVGNFRYACVQCNREDSAEPSLPRAQEELCYRCYVKGIGFSFRGVDGGRESFHNRTANDIHREAQQYTKETGREARPKSKINSAFI